ncbi:MAG TPA: hypothetical protein VNO84_06725 [Burkholderiaceae bacterium]|nr:hypothetical protein [Burkholderiaceae bacterium]
MNHIPVALRPGQLTRRALRSGGMAALTSAMALMWRGRREVGSAAAPLNATSHIAYGDQALHVDRPTVRHTVPGALLHAASGVFWAMLFEALRARRGHGRSLAATAGDAVAATAVAAAVDLLVVPRRLTPGFERRLSGPSLALVYGALAFGLLLGARRLDR